MARPQYLWYNTAMHKKLLALTIAFSVFLFSVPQNAAAFAFASGSAKTDAGAVSSPMKLINMLDISMKMAKVCYGAGKTFFSGFYFSDAAAAAARFWDACKSVFLFAVNEILILRQGNNTKSYAKAPAGYGVAADSSKYMPDKYRWRRGEIINTYLLYIEALHKSSLPASFAFTMKFYNPA
ncbi:MAG: hypothetical protein FWC57_04440 [Endomicrobia bacterium]|nr:hypothetical protein [Endomicrobiia bacterium]